LSVDIPFVCNGKWVDEGAEGDGKDVEIAEGDVGYDDPVGVGDGDDGEDDDQV
jgi:hypothetical protein